MKRRDFMRLLGLGGAAGLAGVERLWAGTALRARVTGEDLSYGPLLPEDGVNLVVLHTNDTHSRMDPFPMDGGRFEGLGGAARRATLIRRVREANEHVLLLDSGDIFQGTPYFNFFGGELEFRAMTAMGYDVATLGNHDFDNGVDGLVAMLPEAGFEFVSANYDVSGSALAGHVEPWTIREFGGVKVGIFGLGIAFEKLVLASLHEGVVYTDPVAAARTACRELCDQGCALVICLSHLGYRYGDPARPSDLTLAAEVPGIDLILGGHTHTFLDEPDVLEQGRDGFTLVNQAGWGGMRLGRIDIGFDSAGQTASSAAAGYDVDDRLDGKKADLYA
ncbi:MAG: metallophosphatase [Gemmatimonadota bacterium]|nr:metallophosphatase [Gemmatimonadota bacterium]MDE2985771.1 metallophosphatase [Gemmatimonadota bacterium]